MEEVWKPIKDFPLYEVSNLGRVKSHAMGWTKILKSGLRGSGSGYPFVNLYKNSAGYMKSIHVLVLEAFVGPRPLGYEANHKDGDKENNNLSNLEWLTSSDNTKHSWKRELQPSPIREGYRSNSAQLSDESVVLIRKMLQQGMRHREIAEKFNVSRVTVTRIKLGQTYLTAK